MMRIMLCLVFLVFQAKPILSNTLEVEVIAKARNYKGVEDDLIEVRIEEFLTTRSFPLLNYIFFDKGSDKLNNYKRYKDKIEQEYSNFNPTYEFINSEIIEVYPNILNIVAYRLSLDKEKQITLKGCLSKDEIGNYNNLGLKRANSVKNYLVDIWGISEDRIKVISDEKLPSNPTITKMDQKLASHENRRVEILSDIDILKPLIIQDTSITSNPPIIAFKNKVESEKDIKKSVLYVRHRGNNIFERKYAKKIDDFLTWEIDEGDAKQLTKGIMLYNLEVENEERVVGRMKPTPRIPFQKLTLSQKKEFRNQDTVFKRYNLILFDFMDNSINEYNSLIIDKVIDDLGSDQKYKIFVSGYTDTLGTESFNKQLSEKRAKSVADELKKRGIINDRISIIAKGESYNPYIDTQFEALKNKSLGDRFIDDKDSFFKQSLLNQKWYKKFISSPEGRFYTRTVIIEVQVIKEF